MKAYLKIEMPKSCASCEWSKLSKMDLGMSCFCTLVKKIGSLEIAKNNRMDFCPIVPVPPHGRLIDADSETFPTPHRNPSNDYMKGWNACLRSVQQQPTIIPAEEGE